MSDRVQTIIRDFHSLLDTKPNIDTIVDDLYNVALGLQSATPLSADFSLISKFIENDVVEYFLLLDQNDAYALISRYIQLGNSLQDLPYINRYYQELQTHIQWHKHPNECISPINTIECSKKVTLTEQQEKAKQIQIGLKKKYYFHVLQLVYIGYQILTIPFLENYKQRLFIWSLSLCQYCCFILIMLSQKAIKSTYFSRKNTHKLDVFASQNDHLMVNQTMQFTWRRCNKCKLVQSKQQVHCRYCDVCVDQFDHHCHFLSQCITKKNYCTFIIMLVLVMIQSFSVLILMGLNKLAKTLIIPQIICYVLTTGIVLLHIGNIRRM